MGREKQKKPVIKKRAAYLCNVKLFLLVLVVLGHSMEQAGMKGDLLYRTIYLFHMPLFAFVSGLHLKTVPSCLRQAKSALMLYLPIQGGIALVVRGQTLTTPYWHLWYLLSLCWWLLLCGGCAVVLKSGENKWKAILLAISVATSLGCGLLPIGRFLSLSRTVVFFPYVLMGMLCPVELQEGPDRRTQRRLLGLSLLGALPVCLVLREAPYAFLYQADGYRRYGMTPSEGIRLRLLCFAAAVGLGLFVLALIPAKWFYFTKIGGDTLPAYLLHVCLLPLVNTLWLEPGAGVLTLFSVALVWLLWELLRWVRPPCAIGQGKHLMFPLTKAGFPFIMRISTGPDGPQGGNSYARTHSVGEAQYERDENQPDPEPGRNGKEQD
ncbi:MAG: hypothetical protein LUE61_07335 [Clostridiales bacterium]|nr:hypothetical protein [Clostridiales bacterium]